MNRGLREMLDGSRGVSEHVIAVLCDIRGFSSFAADADSADVGLYISKIYTKLIDEYFNFASFFKPTGDGILAVTPYEKNLNELSSKVIGSSLRLVKEFSSVCKKDPSIYFDVPESIGIGVTLGSACKIVSGDDTVDYSGEILNLATRLMEYARPSGIVLSHAFGKGLIPQEFSGAFIEDSVFVRGIFEHKRTKIYFAKGLTIIPDWAHSPMAEPQLERQSFGETLSLLKGYMGEVRLDLREVVPNPEQLSVVMSCDREVAGKGKIPIGIEFSTKHFEHRIIGGKSSVIVSRHHILETLGRLGVGDETPIKVTVSFPKPKT